MMRNLKRTQLGVTLFELMLVLFVAAFIAAAVGTIYTRVNNSYKANATLDDVQQLVANIRSLYAQQGSYDGLSLSSDFLKSGLIPPGMCQGGDITNCGSLIYPFGKADIPAIAAGTGATTFSITLSNVPQYVCSDLGTRFYPGVQTLAIGGKTITSATTTADILGACGGTVSFTLTYS